MSFVQPIYLWLLTGLLVPLAIHLLSRKEGKVLRVGSIRHVEESNTSQFKSIRLNEIFLLILRCLMIILLTLFLSDMRCTNPVFSDKSGWLLVEDGLVNDPKVRTAIDSLTNDGYDLRTLSKGFPSKDDGGSQVPADYWQLTDDLALIPEKDIIVLSSNRVQNFIGHRKPLPSHVRWIEIDADPATFLAKAEGIRSDSIRARIATTSSGLTSFQTVRAATIPNETSFSVPGVRDSIKISRRDSVRISMVHDPGFNIDYLVLRSALRTIKQELDVPLSLSDGLASGRKSDWLFWLSEKDVPAFDSKVVSVQASAGPLLRQQSDSRWVLTRRLDPGVAIHENLVPTLFRLLYGEPELRLPQDRRMMEPRMAFAGLAKASDRNGSRTPSGINLFTSVQKYFMVLFLLTWGIERWIAFRKNQ